MTPASKPNSVAPTVDAAATPVFVMAALETLSEEVIANVCQHATDSYPYECCGTIINGRVRHSTNILITSAMPLRGRRAFELDAVAAIAVAEASSARVASIVYHSHPDGSAGFSFADAQAAAPTNQPHYPYLCHLVIKSTSKGVTEVRLYAHTGTGFACFAAWPTAYLRGTAIPDAQCQKLPHELRGRQAIG